jgi:hypothetical protein
MATEWKERFDGSLRELSKYDSVRQTELSLVINDY